MDVGCAYRQMVKFVPYIFRNDPTVIYKAFDVDLTVRLKSRLKVPELGGATILRGGSGSRCLRFRQNRISSSVPARLHRE